MRRLGEREAWRRLGNNILNGAPMEYGLCHLVDDMWFEGDTISIDLCSLMCKELGQHVLLERQRRRAWRNKYGVHYLAPHGEAREARAMLCYLLALEAGSHQ